MPQIVQVPSLELDLAQLAKRVSALERAQSGPRAFPTYTTASKPAANTVPAGTVIFVSNGGAGAVFQGSNGSSWVNLG